MAKISSSSIYDSAQEGPPAVRELKELFRYNYLLIQLIRRDILTRYKRSVLGIAWTMLNPLGTMIVLTLAFSRAFATKDYATLVLSGLLAWTFFAQTTNAIMSHMVWGSSLLKRIYVPRTAFAVAAIGTGLINLVISIVPLILVMLVTGVPIRASMLFLPVSIIFLAMFSLGIGLLISTIAVYFADVAEMYQVIIPAWMYLSPVIYPAEYLPPEIRVWVARLNPMYHLIQMFRTPIYEGRFPDLEAVLLTGAFSIVTLIVGWIIFTRKADEFAYRI